jgi:hypothetical protein
MKAKKIRRQALRRDPYPFDRMSVGESVVCSAPRPNSKYQIARAATFRLAPKVFRAGTGTDGKPRIWREA